MNSDQHFNSFIFGIHNNHNNNNYGYFRNIHDHSLDLTQTPYKLNGVTLHSYFRADLPKPVNKCRLWFNPIYNLDNGIMWTLALAYNDFFNNNNNNNNNDYNNNYNNNDNNDNHSVMGSIRYNQTWYEYLMSTRINNNLLLEAFLVQSKIQNDEVITGGAIRYENENWNGDIQINSDEQIVGFSTMHNISSLNTAIGGEFYWTFAKANFSYTFGSRTKLYNSIISTSLNCYGDGIIAFSNPIYNQLELNTQMSYNMGTLDSSGRIGLAYTLQENEHQDDKLAISLDVMKSTCSVALVKKVFSQLVLRSDATFTKSFAPELSISLCILSDYTNSS